MVGSVRGVSFADPGSARGPAPSVLHVDMDAFFAAAEVLRRPELRGRPVIVGGTGRRGVVAAASYEARRFGVHSAMAMGRARRLCPEAVVLAGDHDYYREISTRVMGIFEGFTPLVEPLSLDEAFLDVGGARRLLGDPERIAGDIRAQVHDAESLDCSVGAAPNKLLAKLASRAAKPRADRTGLRPGPGVVVVRPGEELEFLWPHPVRALWGVGPATLRGLADLGVQTVGDLAAVPPESLVAAFGKARGRRLAELAQAHDPDLVTPERPAKQMSIEVTFDSDVSDRGELTAEVVRQADVVAGRLRAAGSAAGTVVLKLRYGDFRTITRSRRLPRPISHGVHLAREAKRLLEPLDTSPGVRLVGVAAAGLVAPEGRRLSLLEDPDDDTEATEALDGALDELRGRFGDDIIAPAGARSVAARRGGPPDSGMWGPNA